MRSSCVASHFCASVGTENYIPDRFLGSRHHTIVELARGKILLDVRIDLLLRSSWLSFVCNPIMEFYVMSGSWTARGLTKLSSATLIATLKGRYQSQV